MPSARLAAEGLAVVFVFAIFVTVVNLAVLLKAQFPLCQGRHHVTPP